MIQVAPASDWSQARLRQVLRGQDLPLASGSSTVFGPLASSIAGDRAGAKLFTGLLVVHELVLVRVMDHSPSSWNLMRSVIPDVDDARELLRGKALPVID